MSFPVDVAIVGGCGRVGLPLSLAFVQRGVSVCAFDINAAVVATVAQGRMPFDEPGASALLERSVRPDGSP